MVKPKRRRSRVADYTCFGVAAGAPDVIHGEQIAPRHKMHAWLFLNRWPSHLWWYGHSNCDTCVVMQRWHNVMRLLWHRGTCHVSRYTGHDYVICIAIRIAILRSRYNTRIVGPSIAMHHYDPNYYVFVMFDLYYYRCLTEKILQKHGRFVTSWQAL